MSFTLNIDMDGVVYDFHTQMTSYAEQTLGRKLTTSDEWSMFEEWGIESTEFYNMFHRAIEDGSMEQIVELGALDAPLFEHRPLVRSGELAPEGRLGVRGHLCMEVVDHTIHVDVDREAHVPEFCLSRSLCSTERVSSRPTQTASLHRLRLDD